MKKFLSLTNKSLEANGVTTQKDLWQKAQADGYTGLSVAAGVEITKEVDGDTKKFHAVFSSATEDRHGEIVFQNFDLKAFKKNPVYIDSHNYSSIEHILGKVSPISVKDGQLQGDIEFATMNPKGVLAEKMADAGFLNTSSIGFIPKEFDDKGNILKSELLEISAVSVPANPEALFEEKIIAPTDDADDTDAPIEVIEKTNDAGVDALNIAGATVRALAAERQRTLGAVARALSAYEKPSRKRQILKSVREFIQKADIAA
jgi:hypothetical protein